MPSLLRGKWGEGWGGGGGPPSLALFPLPPLTRPIKLHLFLFPPWGCLGGRERGTFGVRNVARSACAALPSDSPSLSLYTWIAASEETGRRGGRGAAAALGWWVERLTPAPPVGWPTCQWAAATALLFLLFRLFDFHLKLIIALLDGVFAGSTTSSPTVCTSAAPPRAGAWRAAPSRGASWPACSSAMEPIPR